MTSPSPHAVIPFVCAAHIPSSNRLHHFVFSFLSTRHYCHIKLFAKERKKDIHSLIKISGGNDYRILLTHRTNYELDQVEIHISWWESTCQIISEIHCFKSEEGTFFNAPCQSSIGLDGPRTRKVLSMELVPPNIEKWLNKTIAISLLKKKWKSKSEPVRP